MVHCVRLWDFSSTRLCTKFSPRLRWQNCSRMHVKWVGGGIPVPKAWVFTSPSQILVFHWEGVGGFLWPYLDFKALGGNGGLPAQFSMQGQGLNLHFLVTLLASSHWRPRAGLWNPSYTSRWSLNLRFNHISRAV